MTHLRSVVLASLALLYLTNAQWDREPLPTPPPPIAEKADQKTDWYAELAAWRLQVANEIRAEHLARRTHIDLGFARQVVASAQKEAAQRSVPTEMVLALIIVESRGNPRAVSPVGALGLMQIMPATGRFIAHNLGENWTGAGRLVEVDTNISFGAWYYRHLLDHYNGHEHAALAAYNWGPGKIQKRQEQGLPLPTIYPEKVYSEYHKLSEVIWDEYKLRFWRGLDQYLREPRQRYRPARSEDRDIPDQRAGDPQQGLHATHG